MLTIYQAAPDTYDDRILQEERFTFIVGKKGRKKRHYEIYPSVIAPHSKPLKAMMNNGMMESINKTAKLVEVEPTTFSRFNQFCHTGVYLSPPKVIIDRRKLALRLAGEKEDAYFCHSCGQKCLHISKSRNFPKCGSTCESQSRHCIRCGREECELPDFDDPFCMRCADRLLRDETQHPTWPDFRAENFAQGMGGRRYRDFYSLLSFRGQNHLSDDLLGHAKLWVFADCYDIPDLQDLCLYRLHRDLVGFHPSKLNINDLVDLLDYVAAHTAEPDYSDDTGLIISDRRSLRELVLRYVICHWDSLKDCERFRDLFIEHGELRTEFADRMA